MLALAPNLKGAERGIAAGVHKLNFPVSASHAHSMSNIRMTPEEAIEQVRKTANCARFRRLAPLGYRGRHLHGVRMHDGGRG